MFKAIISYFNKLFCKHEYEIVRVSKVSLHSEYVCKYCGNKKHNFDF